MKLKLTLQRATGPQSDIVVTTDAAASVGDIAQAIAAADPLKVRLGVDESRGASLRVVDATGKGTQVLPPELTVAESPLASGATVSLVDPDSAAAPAPARQAAAVLRVVAGPDEGATFDLPLGTRYIGRDAAQADVVLGDPLVSKRHARLDVFTHSVRVVDLNSANGVEVDGGTVTRVDLEHGETVRLGDTLLEVQILGSATPDATAPEGPVSFNRSPRVEPRYPGREFKAPSLPGPFEPQAFPWVVVAAPLLIAPVLVFVMGRPEALFFVLLSPIIGVGNFFSQRATRRRKARLDVERLNSQIGALTETLTAEREIERSVRRAETPSTGEILAGAMGLGPVLWTRRPEHWQYLSVNLGYGTLPSRNTIVVSGEERGLPEHVKRVQELEDEFSTVDDVPAAENLYFSGGLGVVGPLAPAADMARNILVQAAGLHSPAELVVAAIVGNAWTGEFEWLKWLPHTASVHSPIPGPHLANSAANGAALLSALEELIAARRSKQVERGASNLTSSVLVAGVGVGEERSSGPDVPVPAIIVLISDDAPVDRARLVQMAETAADAGVFPVWVSATVPELPAFARTYVDTAGEEGTAVVGFVRLGTELVKVATEPVDRETALAFARRLAPVSDASAVLLDSSDLPRSVSMLSLMGPEIAESVDVAIERWRQNDSIHDRSGGPHKKRRAGRLRAIVGQSGVDAMHLDLRTHGPHALVGGTTGAGKSEFLQAWVLGMAAEYSPDRVTFLFVDYKGGSAFADCVSLPHCVGLVTDLSPHLVRRALTSLRAELHYREHFFNRKKVKDLLELEKRGDPESPPALVLVIDAFAALAQEVPEFVDGVVDIAQRGRSLGIHLIMATQRPAGVIKDNLRANTNLRIALRMADESDSKDVVGDPVAATFDPAIPGRAIAKMGPGRLTSFQSAYAGGWTTDAVAAPTVELAELRFGAEQVWERPGPVVEVVERDEGPTDQARLVRTLIGASRAAKIPAPRRPWLDTLAPVFDLTKLSQRTDTELVIGVRDLPHLQRQEVVHFRPDADGSIAVFGTGGSGKSTLLRSLAAAAGITPRGGPVEVYGLDFGTGSLRMLEALPHVGSIVSGDDPERVVRLLRQLKGTLEERSARYAEVDAGSIVDYRRLADRPDEPRILLLVDNYPAFRTEFESSTARAPWYQALHQLVAEGRQLGIHVALSADRPGSMPSALAAGIQRRVALRLADETAYALLDYPRDILDSSSPPGRAIVDGFETQVAIVGDKQSVADQSRALAALAAAMRAAGRADVPPVGSLPKEYPAAALPDDLEGMPVLGISDDTLEPISFDPTGVFLLAGPPGSGRTTALEALVGSLRRAMPKAEYYYFGPARSQIGALEGWASSARTPDDIVDLAKELSATIKEGKGTTKIVVVVEQVADYLSSPADAPLTDLFKAIKRSDQFLLAESETSSWSSSWPLLAEVRSARTGLLLQPESIEGEMLMKTTLPRVGRGEFPPGRGFYITRGKAVRVQLPMP
ncbi:FtsK/SpoIIIE domain-containing protein [soil metagenome]